MKGTPIPTSRLAIGLAVGLVLMIVLASVSAIWILRAQEMTKWEKQTESYSVVLSETVSQQMDFAYSTLSSIAERIQDRWNLSPEIFKQKTTGKDFYQFIKDKAALSPLVEVISVFDENGSLIATTRQFPAPPANMADREYFSIQKSDPAQGIYLSSVIRSKLNGELLFFLSHRLTSTDGEFLGIVTLGISPDFYSQFYQRFNTQYPVVISLLRNNFTYLARWPQSKELLGEKSVTEPAYEIIQNQSKKHGTLFSEVSRGGEAGSVNKTRLSAVRSLEKYPLITSFSVDDEVYLSDWRKISTGIIVIAIFSVFIVLAAFSMLVNLLEKREQDLAVTTELKQQAEVINRDQSVLLQNLTQQQTALRDFSDQLQAIFQNAADGIIMLDERGIIEAINPAAVAIYGAPEKEVVGRSSKIFSPPGHPDLLSLAVRSHEFQSTGRVRIETERRRKDGEVFAAELAMSEYKLAGKRKLVVIMRDISERRKVERMKSEFISTVSHELRTPLTAIRGSLGLVVGGAMGKVSEKLLPLLSMAHKNSENLTRLINDLLDIQKIEAGKMEFVFENQSVHTLLNAAVQQNQAYAANLGTEIILDNSIASSPVRVDSVRFQQILNNLLSNACKYSPQGVPVRVRTVPVNEYFIRIEVIDQGSGIPEHFKDQIFQKFSQADSSDSRKKGGTGLGLAISQALARQMQGNLGYYQGEGDDKGTHFYLDLPLVHDEETHLGLK